MSTEEIRTRAFLIHFMDQPLYLVPDRADSRGAAVPAVVAVEAKPDPPVPLAYEGLNQRGVVVVTDGLTDEDRVLLWRILQSVHLLPDDVALFVQPEFDALAHQQALAFDYLIAFGTRLAPPLTNTLYQATRAENFLALRAHALSHLATHTADKRALWQALQPIFT